ncbi:MAG: hypothetical protein V4444_09765 [Pseudomonadota bacterium]
MSNEKTVNVTVIHKPGATPNVELVSDDLPIVDGNLVFKNDANDGFFVRFNLDPTTLGKYYFPNTKDEALFVKVNQGGTAECPKSGTWDGFRPHKLDNGNKTLVVFNKNGKLPANKKEERFSFTLRVREDKFSGTDFLELDPGGINQNGGVKATSWMSTALLVGVAVGVVATLAAQTLLPG